MLDLSSLNRFVPHVHFQMEVLHCLKTFLRKWDYMTSTDPKDTYFSVPIHKSSQRFLRFIWGTKHFTFLGLPFGLSSAPRIFTKLLKPAAAFLRKQGYRIKFRRLPSSCLLQRGSIAFNSNVVKSITVPGLSHKLDEINTVPCSVNNIPRLCHKLCGYDHLLTKGQSSKGLCSLQQRSLST